MRVNGVSRTGGVSYSPPSRLEHLANWVVSQIGKARRTGESEVVFLLKDNDVTQKLVERFSQNYDVSVQHSDTLKVRIKV